MYARLVRLLWGLLILWAQVLLGVRDAPAASPETVNSTRVIGSRPPGAGQPGPLILDDAPEPLVEKQPRTEADRDQIEALSLFAAGRMLEQRQQYARALRHYQRALRYDPEAVTVARAIVPLAFRLKRHAEAVRYALKVVKMEDADPLLLERLGAYLIEVGDLQGAVKLYERAVAARGGEKTTAADVRLQMELGRLYHLVEEYGKAADCFARVRDALEDPRKFGIDDRMKELLLSDPGLTYNLLGDCFLRAGRTDDAVAAFKKAHDLAADQGLLQFNLARVHARKKEPRKALASLQSCFQEKLASEGTAPYQLFAEVLEAVGKKDELIGRLEKLHGADPNNVPLGYFLAETYLKAEKLEKAELLYRALVQKTPTLTGYRSLIEICRKTGRPDPLLEILGEAVAKTGELEMLGPEAKAVAGDADLIRALVDTARKKFKTEPDKLDYGMRLAVALLAMESKQFDTAGEFFDLALKSKPDEAAELLLVWGVTLLLEERSAEAVKVFRRAIDEKALPKDNPVFYYYLAGALAMDEQADEAIAAARKAVEMARAAAGKAAEQALAAKRALAAAQEDTERAAAQQKAILAAAQATKKKEDWVRFRSRVGWVLYHAKRNDQAIQAYRKLIDEYDPDHESSQIREVLRDVRLALSNLYVLQEDFPAAEESLEQVLDEFPDDVGASNDLGYLWADQDKHLQRALKMIQHAVDAEPGNVAYRDSLGWAFYRLGRYREAVVELQKAVDQQKKTAADDAPDAVILEHLGDAHLEAGQPEKAKNAWRRAVEAFKKQQQPEKAKAVEEKIKNHN